jgi:hypothetical protein
LTALLEGRAGSLWAWLQRPAVFAPLLAILGWSLSAVFADRGLPANDEGALLTNAAKLLRGALYYRDIDAYPFPGAAYLLAGAMGLFGEHLSVARALAAIVFVTSVVSLYAASLGLLGRGRAALFGLSLLSFKFLAWPGFTAYMYADVALAAACVAIALGFGPGRRGRLRLLLAGVCVGLSVACKQNLGIPVAGVALALLAFPQLLLRVPRDDARAHRLDAAVFAAGLAATLLPIAGYFAWHGVLAQMATSGLMRPFTAYLPTSGVAFATPLAWWQLGELRGMDAFPYSVGPYWSMLVRDELPGPGWYSVYWVAGEIFSRCLYTSVPLVFAGALWRWARALRERRVSEGERRRFAFALLAFAVVLSAFPRADFYHVIGVYPVVLLVWFGLGGSGESADTPATRRGRGIWRAGLAVALLLAVTGALTVVHVASGIHEVELERARLRLSPAETFVEPVVRYLQDEVAEGEALFVYGHEAYYYFLAGRFSPWPFSQLYPGQAGGDAGRALSELLEREPPKRIVSGMLSWPGMPPLPGYTSLLVEHLQDRFEVAPDVFRRYPPPGGRVPPGWTVTVLQPRPTSQPGVVH